MNCPNCNTKLESKIYKEIPVDSCPNCGGMWLDSLEVDQLEDTVFDEDELKNTMITNIRSSEKKCPKCGGVMKRFNYRWEDLELEYCEVNHGFWLDKGEEEKITQHMDEYEGDLERKAKIEHDWENQLKRFKSPSFIQKITNIFRGV